MLIAAQSKADMIPCRIQNLTNTNESPVAKIPPESPPRMEAKATAGKKVRYGMPLPNPENKSSRNTAPIKTTGSAHKALGWKLKDNRLGFIRIPERPTEEPVAMVLEA